MEHAITMNPAERPYHEEPTMARIAPIDLAAADPKARTILEGVQKALGMTPNLMATLAHSPASLEAYLGFGQALAGGSLGGRLREQIAVAVAGANSCGYCASAHTAIGSNLGIEADELARNLGGSSQDARTEAVLGFARTLVGKRGWASDEDLAAVRAVGLSEGEIVEIVATVAINMFTNYFNHVADTEIDFPRVEVGDLVAVS